MDLVWESRWMLLKGLLVTVEVAVPVVLMSLVGGLGTVFGPVVGAFIIIAMQDYLAQIGERVITIGGTTFTIQLGQWVIVIQGVIFVLCVLLFRRGVIGEIAKLLRIRL